MKFARVSTYHVRSSALRWFSVDGFVYVSSFSNKLCTEPSLADSILLVLCSNASTRDRAALVRRQPRIAQRTALHRTHAPMAAIQSRAWRVARAHPISRTELLDVQTLAVTLIAPVARPALMEVGVLT